MTHSKTDQLQIGVAICQKLIFVISTVMQGPLRSQNQMHIGLTQLELQTPKATIF
jgi:hypothetical protein